MSDIVDMRARASAPPKVVICFAKLGLIKWSLKYRGLASTVALCVTPRRGAVRTISTINDEVVQTIVHRIAIAAALYPGRARCLEQSLVLLAELRHRGVPAELRLGVKPYRFQSHAWIEVGGLVVNDSTERIKAYAVLPPITV
jgi:hypothetical protein